MQGEPRGGSSGFVRATADIRGDYRYSLTRVWDPARPTVTFVLLNPSTADASRLDPTLRRCLGFADRDGYGGLTIVNLYAFRATDPREMLAAADPVGPDNDRILGDVTGIVIAGWGARATSARVARAVGLLPSLHALGVTKDGHPRHPLFIPREASLRPWRRPALLGGRPDS